MNGFKVFAFFFIVILAFVSCASTSNFPGDIEMGNTLIMRRVVQNGVQNGVENGREENEEENDLSDEVHFFPVMTLDQYRTSLIINISIYFLYLIFNVDKHSKDYKMLFSLALAFNTLVYFISRSENPRNNVQTVSVNRLLFTSCSWLIQSLLLLTYEENIDFIDKVLPKAIFGNFIFFLELVYYFSAFNHQVIDASNE
jgi:hypothetical protein